MQKPRLCLQAGQCYSSRMTKGAPPIMLLLVNCNENHSHRFDRPIVDFYLRPMLNRAVKITRKVTFSLFALTFVLAVWYLGLGLVSAQVPETIVATNGPIPLLVNNLPAPGNPSNIESGDQVCVSATVGYTSGDGRWVFHSWSTPVGVFAEASSPCLTTPQCLVYIRPSTNVRCCFASSLRWATSNGAPGWLQRPQAAWYNRTW